ncbi:MAG: serine/threonine protein kinase [Candidatus Thermoplasmatota archaeon]|nr:serine/threonine protein kinase [Candidatus Thermoplasmatota archaeon]
MATQPNQALPNGYRLNEYTIVRKIGGGGFSMVYLARDDNNQSVAIKEYLPGALVLRTEGSVIVQASSTENNNIFRHGMKCFFEEGRALARIDHPNVVRVTNFFRANDTVYMVMRFERGKTLQQHIQANRGTIRESFIRRVFAQLLNGLREVHTHKLLHLDIKPSNLYIRLDGSPVLIDFGAARQTLTQEESKLQPMYTPGFAAPEQYHNRERLGPWSDIYSIGAGLYACLAGYPPQAADARLLNDKLVPAATNWRGAYSDQLLETIDHCLKLNYMERPQSVFSLQKVLMDRSAMTPPRSSLLSSLKRSLSKELF